MASVGVAQPQRDVYAFFALTAFGFVMYAVPGAWIPALEPLRLALLTSGVAAGLFALRRLGRAEPVYFDGARGWALLAFTALAVSSIAWSVYPDGSEEAAIELLKLTAIYLALVNVVTTPRRLTVLAGALVLGSLVTSWGVIQWHAAGVDMVEGYRSRWVGVYADPNRTAMNVGIVVPLCAAFLARKNGGWLFRALCMLAMGLAVTAIVLTYSRGGFIGLCVGMGLWVAREHGRRVQGAVVAALLFVSLAVFAPQTFWARNETVGEFHQDASAMGRVHAWQVASRISLDRPLLGVGLGGFRYAWSQYAPPEARRAYVAHNIFLDVIGELGWLGLAAFLVFAGGAAAGAFEASRDRDLGWLSRGIAASVAGYLVTQLFAGYVTSAHLYVLFGMAACAQRIARASTAAAPAAEAAPAPAAPGVAWEGSGHAA